MNIEDKYMHRCLELAKNGMGYVSPNPMVGAVIVHDNRIIGEGYHCRYGKAHAEVNAINSVENKELLKNSTLYVSLEPCAHHGKTPPCAQLIIDNHIPRVVIACLDPNPKVSGKGVKILEDKGIDTHVGTLEKEASILNKEFFVSQIKHRPYIYLKWAQSADGFIDKIRIPGQEAKPTVISNSFTQMLVHKKRAEVQAIMVGTNTAVNDNPALSTRLWHGNNPLRVVIDKDGRIPFNYKLLDGQIPTIVFTEKELEKFINIPHLKFLKIAFNDNLLENILQKLHELHIISVLVEGGAILLQSFINKHLWDEAYVEISNTIFTNGIKAPSISGDIQDEYHWGGSTQIYMIPKPV